MTKTVNNLFEYKRAKVLIVDLERILKVVNLAISALGHFTKYAPVGNIITNLRANKTLLEIHHNKYKKIVDNKGQMKSD